MVVCDSTRALIWSFSRSHQTLVLSATLVVAQFRQELAFHDRSSKTIGMPKQAKRGDINQIAASIVEQTTRFLEGDQTKFEQSKNPAAVALGKLGGKKGGPARAAALSPRKRKLIAKKAAKARWSKKS